MGQPELFEPGEYLQTGRPGYFSVLSKLNGDAKQQSYELQHLEKVVRGLNPFQDTWITQAVFKGPNRRAVNLRDVGLLFADLDTYRTETLKGKTPEEQAAALCSYCSTEGIPTPSVVLFSGRGLQAKWFLSAAVEPVDLFEWNQAQLALVRLLESFSADMASRDVSRVLRVDRTVNTKSGAMVRVVHVTGGIEACPARYDFQQLRELLVRHGLTVEKPEIRRQAKDRPALALPREYTFKRLNWARLYDIRNLWTARGGVPEGFRELTLFHEICFLLHAEPGRVDDLWREAETLAAQIAPGTSFYRRSDLGTVYRRAMASRAGEVVEYGGRTYPPLYTPKNETLLEVFRITPEEERNMRTVISETERQRRQTERRRAAGVKVRVLYGPEKPWDAEGISRRTWFRRRGQT